MMRLTLKQTRGFTLIEALFAIFILSVGILTVAKLQGTSVKGDAKAGGLTRASLMASDQIENMMLWEFDDARLTSGEAHYPEAECVDRFCIRWEVIDDMPVPPVTLETDGETAIPSTTVSKTIQVVVFEYKDNAEGESTEEKVLHMSCVKTLSLSPTDLEEET